MTPLEWVCFAHQVRVSLSTHEQLYAETSGWTVHEVEPGHIMLSHRDITPGRVIEVRGVGYTMLRKPEQAAAEAPSPDSVAPTAAEEAERKTETRRKRR